jgi:NAD(P)-dependent dehydrogenase (short-subunit alcohol dehydrogenase family)
MAKAALNMMTRTSAPAYAVEKIYMNSVDTGWCVHLHLPIFLWSSGAQLLT